MPSSVAIIGREHRNIAAVIHCLEQVLKEVRDRGLTVDPASFRAAFAYIEDFPERFHHPKEDEYPFKCPSSG